jgi:hypothetical protein
MNLLALPFDRNKHTNTNFMAKKYLLPILICSFAFIATDGFSQTDTGYTWSTAKKNIIRYNVSSALIFGFDKTIILGYERMLKPNRSFSINAGTAALPKLGDLVFDSISFRKLESNTGFNLSADYRFYLDKLNRYHAPRGVYIGPYYSLNNWQRENDITITTSTASQKLAKVNTDFSLHMVGFELGYQFIFWKKLALDMVLIGPGIGFYNIKAKTQGDLTDSEREKLYDALTQVISDKFPGMNYVLSEEGFSGSGTIRTSNLGFRYLVHIGFLF